MYIHTYFGGADTDGRLSCTRRKNAACWLSTVHHRPTATVVVPYQPGNRVHQRTRPETRKRWCSFGSARMETKISTAFFWPLKGRKYAGNLKRSAMLHRVGYSREAGWVFDRYDHLEEEVCAVCLHTTLTRRTHQRGPLRPVGGDWR